MRKVIIIVLEVLNWFIDYLVETWMNKLCAVLLAGIILFVSAYMKDITPLFGMLLVVWLFFTTKNVFK